MLRGPNGLCVIQRGGIEMLVEKILLIGETVLLAGLFLTYIVVTIWLLWPHSRKGYPARRPPRTPRVKRGVR